MLALPMTLADLLR